MIDAAKERIGAKAVALRETIESNLERLIQLWLVAASLASAARVAFSPVQGPVPALEIFAPYVLLIVAPPLSMVLALRWFRNADRQAQPSIRLARVGRWKSVTAASAKAHPLYGVNGFMVSLMIGILLNIPIRALEYFAAMPALAGNMPPWLAVLRAMMTLDVVMLSSLYAIAFVAALRRVPLFPRLIVAIWAIDLTLQVVTAQLVAAEPGLPPAVAASLQGLLTGNVQKVLISMALWLPYLLLSKRVNVTFRQRVPA